MIGILSLVWLLSRVRTLPLFVVAENSLFMPTDDIFVTPLKTKLQEWILRLTSSVEMPVSACSSSTEVLGGLLVHMRRQLFWMTCSYLLWVLLIAS